MMEGGCAMVTAGQVEIRNRDAQGNLVVAKRFQFRTGWERVMGGEVVGSGAATSIPDGIHYRFFSDVWCVSNSTGETAFYTFDRDGYNHLLVSRSFGTGWTRRAVIAHGTGI